MKSKKILVVFFLFSLTIKSIAGIILPDDNFVTGWTTTGKTSRFLENDLFNYINGGAELFHEFGFKQLLVQGYRQWENEIVLEVYQMKSPEAALGIFLMKCGNETPIDGINARNSGNKYQFTVLKGSYFIQVNSFAGNEKLIPVMTELTQQTLKFVSNEKPVQIFDNLPKENLISGSELIVRGPFALQPIYTFGEGDIFQLNGKIYAVLGDYQDEQNGKYTQIVIKYPDEKDALAAYESLIENLDPYLEISENLESGFIFKDYQNKFGLVSLKDESIEIMIKLKQKPTVSTKGS